MSMDNCWTLTTDTDGIAWLTFDRPGERVNAFTSRALEDLDRYLGQLAADDTVRAVVIGSAKRDSFVVGADIAELARIDSPEDAKAKSDAGHWVFSRLEALELWTNESAYAAFEEQDLGSLEVGKLADLVVLSDAYLTIPEAEIRTLGSVLTFVGGAVVHAEAEFDGLGD